MNKIQALQNFTYIISNKSNKFKSFSKEPLDGSFIQYSPKDSFSNDTGIVYGEEQDVDDL